jgi:menaquinone-dependent protoporphyrinogen IX oxidase
MVDILSLLSAALLIIVGIPTTILIVGKIISLIVSLFAREVDTLEPEGKRKGRALIVYEPGATGLTKKVGEHIAGELLRHGYEVKAAGLRAPEAKETAGYDILVYGTPTYIGRPTGAFKKLVKKLRPASGQVFGFFATGTRGAPSVGFVPKVFLDGMKKPLEESGIQAREMIFVGYRYEEFNYGEFVARLMADEAQMADINKDAPSQ